MLVTVCEVYPKIENAGRAKIMRLEFRKLTTYFLEVNAGINRHCNAKLTVLGTVPGHREGHNKTLQDLVSQ